MFSFFAILGTLVTLIAAFWNPFSSALVYWIFALLFEAYLYFVDRATAPKLDGDSWSAPELAVLQKYHLYFRFPFASQDFSRAISTIQLSVLIWVPVLLFSGHWIFAIIVAANYFLAAPLAPKLNIRFFLHDAVERQRKLEYIGEMSAVDSVCEKILQMQRDARTKP